MLKGKVALVTGSGRSIGKVIAHTLAKEGANIVVNDIDSSLAKETEKELQSLGIKTIISCANVTKKVEMEDLFNEIEKRFGRLDILVNNAGITRDGILMKLTEEKWDEVVDVNLKGVFICSQLAVKIMSKQNCGKIVNMSSVAGQMGNVGQINYSATKAGVIGMTKTLAKELARYQINVNAIAPGLVDTPMTKTIPEKVMNTFISQIPLGYIAQPEDIANLVKFLVSDDSRYITGQIIACNGGWYM